jgi:hypothetical protein
VNGEDRSALSGDGAAENYSACVSVAPLAA